MGDSFVMNIEGGLSWMDGCEDSMVIFLPGAKVVDIAS